MGLGSIYKEKMIMALRNMLEFLLNCTELLYPLSLVEMNVGWSDLRDVPCLDVMLNEFKTWRTP